MAYPFLQTTLELIGVFCLATLAGYLSTWAKRARHGLHPVAGAKVRIRGRHQVYHCRLEEMKASGWTFGPPLTRDRYYPLSPGERIVAEAAVGSGRLLFRTVLVCGDRSRGRIWVQPPRRTYYVQPEEDAR